MDRGAWWATVQRVARVRHDLATKPPPPQLHRVFPGDPSGKKNPPDNARDTRDWDRALGREAPLEEEMATHSSILAWEILWTEEPGGLQSIGSQRVGHN